jgi:hypothetical protein
LAKPSETEQIGPGVTGAYGGIVAQVQPQVYYNATFTMAPTGQGQAAFFNPALGFKCLGAVKFFQGTSYSASQANKRNRSNKENLFFLSQFFLGFQRTIFRSITRASRVRARCVRRLTECRSRSSERKPRFRSAKRSDPVVDVFPLSFRRLVRHLARIRPADDVVLPAQLHRAR